MLDDQKSDADDVIVIGDDEDADADENDGDKPRAAKPKRAYLRQSAARAASQGAPCAAASTSTPLEENAPLPALADQTHRLLVLSRVDSSHVLEAGADFTELDESGFCTGDATVAVGHMHCNALVDGAPSSSQTTFLPIVVAGSTRES